jgi:mannose-1-phosphate guanylyltransferase
MLKCLHKTVPLNFVNHPIIFCVGDRNRLWPLSLKASLNHFIPLLSGKALLQFTPELVALSADGSAVFKAMPQEVSRI